MKKILLDTNAYSRLLLGERHVLDATASADVVFMSVFVLGELHAGFQGGRKKKENLRFCTVFYRNPLSRFFTLRMKQPRCSVS